MKKIILASQSPRRKQLLEWAEIPFEVVIKPTDESYPGGLSHSEVAVHIARQKAFAVKATVGNDDIILAADTIVVLGERIIGKPRDKDDAIKILIDLSGQKHVVITGVVIQQGEKEISFADETEVIFDALTNDEIRFYVEKYQPFDKAGAYAIQEWIGVVGIQKVVGDFYNVMGLPVSRVFRALQKFNTL